MKKVLLIIFGLLGVVSSYSQTFNCNFLTAWESEPKLKSSNSTITISSNEITISKFFNGGTEPLKMTIDSMVVKDYNFHESTWYYCHSDRKDIVIIPVSKIDKRIDLFDFADEVTMFHYGFSYR